MRIPRLCSRNSAVALVLALAALATLAACKKDGGGAPPDLGRKGPVVDVDKLEAPPLFAHIPADTPYVMASFEAVPLAYYAKVRQAAGPELARALDQLRALGGPAELERWIDAVTDELAGKWSAKGLESLGLSAQPRFAIYGHGALPAVLRLEVKDAKAVLATVERIAHRAGAKLPALETRHGREFWRIELPADFGAIVSLTDGQLVAAIGPRHAIAAVLPQIVGAEKPSRNMAGGEELKRLIAKHQLGPVLVGYVDTKRLGGSLLALVERDTSDKCAAAIDRLAAAVPRLAFSYTELTDKRFSAAAILELAPALAEQLKAMRTPVPGLAAALADEPMFAMGGGLDLRRGQAAGKAAAVALGELGLACDAAGLQRAADEMLEAMATPLPGPLGKLAGGALAIDAIDFGGGAGGGRRAGPPIPRSLDAFAMLAVSDAKAVLDSMSAELALLGGLQLKPDGKLRALELGMLPLPFEVHGGVGERALAVAVGSRGKRRAERAITASGDGPAPFLAGTLDMSKLTELQARLATILADDDADPADAVTRDVDSALSSMIGRATFSVDATDAGLGMWFSGELK